MTKRFAPILALALVALWPCHEAAAAAYYYRRPMTVDPSQAGGAGAGAAGPSTSTDSASPPPSGTNSVGGPPSVSSNNTPGGGGTSPPPNTLSVSSPGDARARVGMAFSLAIPISGANGAVTWSSIGDALPPGLSLRQDGTIAGTATSAARAAAVQVLAIDSAGQSSTTPSFAVDARPLPSVSYAPPANAQAGTALTLPATVSDAYGTQSWTLASGALPPGMALDPGTGTISGTPTSAGPYPGIATAVTDGDGARGTSAAFALPVSPKPTLSYVAATLDVGPTYAFSPQVSGLTGPLSYTLASRTGAANCQGIDGQGVLTCSQTAGDGATGTYVVNVSDANGRTASSGPVAYVNGSGAGFSAGTGRTVFYARSGSAFSGAVKAANAPGNVAYTALDPLPAGFTLDGPSGAVTSANVPSSAIGSSSVRVRASSGQPPVVQTATAAYGFSAAAAPTASSPTAQSPPRQGSSYRASGTVANMFGGATPSVTAAGLPPGLSVAGTPGGYAISGTPTQSGSYPATITATDPADGASATATPTLSVAAASVTASPASQSLVEGDAAAFSFSTAIQDPTWTWTGAPAWLALSPSGATLSASGTSPATPQAAGYQVTATATGGGVSASATVNLSVSPSTTSFTDPGPVRSGGTVTIPVSTTLNAAGSWSATGWPGANLSVASPSSHATTVSGTAPANAGTAATTQTLTATFATSAMPASGSPAAGSVSPSVTIYPALSLGAAADASYTAGSPFSSSPPVVTGGYGTVAWQLWSGGQDVSSSLGSLVPGLSFDRATGRITGTPGQSGNVRLSYRAHDDGRGLAAMAADAASNDFALAGGPATASASVPNPSLQPGDALASTVTTSLASPTWSVSGAPSWVTATPSGNTLRLTGTAPALTQAGDYPVAVTAANAAASTVTNVAIHVAPVTASLASVTTRTGRAFSVALATNYPGGAWTMQPTSPADVAFSGYASGSFAGTAPANAGTSAIARTMTAALPGGATSSPGTLTVYPDLSLAAPADRSGTTGSSVSFGPPTAYGTVGALTWRLYLAGGAEVTSSLGTQCPGLSFTPSTGAVSGQAASACSVSLRYAAADDAGGATALQESASSPAFALQVADAPAPKPVTTASTSNVSAIEGSPVPFSVTTTLASPTWSVTGNPSWMTFSASGQTYATNSVSPDLDPAQGASQSWNVVVTASGGAAAPTSSTVAVTVSAASASVGSASVRSGAAFSVPISTTMAAAGAWTANVPADVTGVSASGSALSGTAPTNPGTSAITRTLGAAYRASAAPSAGAAATASGSGTLTVQPALTMASQSNQAAYVGSPVLFAAPSVGGAVGTLTYALLQESTDVSSTLGNVCPGLSFSSSNGAIQGTPSTTCTANLTYKVSDDGNGDFALASSASPPSGFTLAVGPAIVTASTSSVSALEGDTVAFSATTSLPNPTWSVSGNPPWMTFTASGGSYSTSSVSADVSAAPTYPVVLTATSGSYTASATVGVTVTDSSVSVSAPTPRNVRVGQQFSATYSKNMKAAGTWTGSSNKGDVTNFAFANGTMTANAPASVQNDPETRTYKATYTANVGPSSGAAATQFAMQSVTVSPNLSLPSTPQNQVGKKGTAQTAVYPPPATGQIGRLTYALMAGTTDVTSSLGSAGYCPGLSFGTADGTITGTPTAACSVAGLSYKATDDGNGIASLQQTAQSPQFSLNVSSSIPDQFSFPAVSNAAGGTAVSGSATLSGMTSAGTLSVSSSTGATVALGINGSTPSTSIPATVPANAQLTLQVTSAAGSNGGTQTATVTVSGVSATFSVTTMDTTPDAFSWASAGRQQLSAPVTSPAATITGLTAPAAVAVSGVASATVSVNGGAFTASPPAVSNGQTVAVRMTSSSAGNASQTATVTIGGVSGTFTVTTGNDVPNNLNCLSGTNSVYPANGGQEYFCQVNLSGMDVPAQWSVSGSFSRIYTDATGWTTATSGTLAPNSRINFAVLAPSGTNGGTNVGYFKVSSSQQSLTVRTGDTQPDGFSWPTVYNQPPGVGVGSNYINITGIDQPSPVSVSNGSVSINGAAWSQGGTIYPGQTLAAAVTSSAAYDGSNTVTVNVGGVSGNFIAYTQSYPCDGTGNSATNQNEYFYYNSDVQNAGWVAMRHWIRFGVFEGRRSCFQTPACNAYGDGGNNPQNANMYYYFNPDVKNAGIDAYTHWVNYGQNEGRIGCYPRSDNR